MKKCYFYKGYIIVPSRIKEWSWMIYRTEDDEWMGHAATIRGCKVCINKGEFYRGH